MNLGYDIGTAFSDTFRFVREKWVWMLVWGAALIILPTLPVIPLFGWLIANAAELGNDPDAINEAMGLNLLSNLASVIQIALGVFIYGAVVRYIVGIQRTGQFAGLRAGMDELWVLVCMIIYYIGMLVALMAIIAVASIIGLIVSLASGVTGVGVGIGILVGLAGIVPVVWAGVRLSLLIPASVEKNTLAFSQAWNASKGRFWPLLGTWVIIMLISIVLTVILTTIIGVVGLGVMGTGAAMGLEMDAASLTSWVPLIVVGVLLLLVPVFAYTGIYYSLMVAPFASAWRQINPNVVEHFS